MHVVLLSGTFLVKFNENRPKSSEAMERTRNSRVNPLTLSCDLDLESR